MRRRQSVPVDSKLREICVELQRRLGLTRAIRYAQCQWLEAPAVIGWFRPVVFLPLTALTGLSEAQLRAVIAHELAHIKRLDSFVNAFQVFVETLLFYHPAVWWLEQAHSARTRKLLRRYRDCTLWQRGRVCPRADTDGRVASSPRTSDGGQFAALSRRASRGCWDRNLRSGIRALV